MTREGGFPKGAADFLRRLVGGRVDVDDGELMDRGMRGVAAAKKLSYYSHHIDVPLDSKELDILPVEKFSALKVDARSPRGNIHTFSVFEVGEWGTVTKEVPFVQMQIYIPAVESGRPTELLGEVYPEFISHSLRLREQLKEYGGVRYDGEIRDKIKGLNAAFNFSIDTKGIREKDWRRRDSALEIVGEILPRLGYSVNKEGFVYFANMSLEESWQVYTRWPVGGAGSKVVSR